MRIILVGLFTIGLTAPVAAKPAPGPETLRFVAACAREYAWVGFDRPENVRAMAKEEDVQMRRGYFAARAQVHASQTYLRRLSPRAFQRRLDDALYLTTPRSPDRCAVAYVAAMRGVDTLVNCRRMNDAVLGNLTSRRPQEWEEQLLDRVEVDGYLGVNVLSVPQRLMDVYRRRPDDRILSVIYQYPAGSDGEGQMTLITAISSAAAEWPLPMLRVAAHDGQALRLAFGLCGMDADPKGREQALRLYPRIARSSGPLATAARQCLRQIARYDAERARDLRRARAEKATRWRRPIR